MPEDEEVITQPVEGEEEDNLPEEVPMGVPREERSTVIEDLFPSDGTKPHRHLEMVTRTPAHMVMTLVRMRMVAELFNPKRNKSLMEIWLEEYDTRMISVRGQGRDDYLRVQEAKAKQEEQDVVELD